MIFSRAVLGTANKKTKLNWWDYWINHCWMTGWQSIKHSFQNWSDLMTDNWKDYALLNSDDPFEECYGCFWSYLGEDDTLPKEFLEHLQQMVEDIETGKEKLIPMDEVMMNRLKNLTEDVELDDVEEFEKDWKTLQELMNDDTTEQTDNH
jgi:hypothetical protein